MNNPSLTREEWKLIDRQLREKGISHGEYIEKATDVETDVKCPICGNNFIYSSLANSREIRCKTENCLKRTLRGI